MKRDKAGSSEHFAERLRVSMAKANVTGAAIARETGVTPQAVAKWTTGKAFPSSSHLMCIVRMTGCTLDWIMTNAPVDVSSPSAERAAYLISELKQIVLGASGGGEP